MTIKKIDSKYLAEISSLNSLTERNAALNWFADQSEEIKISVLERHGSLLHQRHLPGIPVTPELSFSLLILASKQIRIYLNSLHFKRDLTIAETEDFSRIRIEGFRKPAKKKISKKLNRFKKEFLPLATLLRSEHKYSWNEIVGYLWKHHQYDISKAYIQQIFKKLSKEDITYEK